MLRYAFILLTAAAVGGAVAPGSSDAYFRRFHGAACAPQNPGLSTIYSESLGMVNNAFNAATFICPVMSDSNLSHHLANFVRVHGQKGVANGTVDTAVVCRKFWNGNGFVCNLNHSTSAAGPWTLNPPPDWFTDTFGADFPYVKVTIQPGSGIFGLFLDGP